MNIRLSKREVRCLRRVAECKSIPDFQCFGWLIDKGLCTMEGESSDDVQIGITQLGASICKLHNINNKRPPSGGEERKP
jgi:hypothetical protein